MGPAAILLVSFFGAHFSLSFTLPLLFCQYGFINAPSTSSSEARQWCKGHCHSESQDPRKFLFKDFGDVEDFVVTGEEQLWLFGKA